MEGGNKILSVDTITAAENLSVKRFVGFDGKLCGVDKRAFGISLYNFSVGEDASVVTYGIMEVETGGVIQLGADVASDGQGRAVSADSPEGVNPVTGADMQSVLGQARDSSSTEGQFIRVVLR